MRHFLERGDAEFWDKEAIKLHRFLDKIDRFFNNHYYYSKNSAEIKSIYKSIRHFKKIFTEK